jgi:hypothetical protein
MILKDLLINKKEKSKSKTSEPKNNNLIILILIMNENIFPYEFITKI